MGRVGVELLEAGGDVGHGNGGCAWEGGDLDLPGLAHVEQQGRLGMMSQSGVGFGQDLRCKAVWHGMSIPGPAAEK